MMNNSFNINFKIKWIELFPTNFSFFIFCGYVTLFVNLGLLTKATQKSASNSKESSNSNNSENSKYDYNYTTVVLMTEFLKLSFTSAVLLHKFKIPDLIRQIKENLAILFIYTIPAGLYVAYNNLAFISLKNFTPATYLLLLNLRTVIIGVIYQIFFRKKLSSIQWLSLIVLTFSCILKQIDVSKIFESSYAQELESLNSELEGQENLGITASVKSTEILTTISATSKITAFIFMLIQILSSVTANVYNEFLLKDRHTLNFWIQNLFMYFNGLCLNLLVCLIKYFLHKNTLSALSSQFDPQAQLSAWDSLFYNFTYKHWCLILNQVFLGISASLLLKHLNSIVKALSTAIEMILSAYLQYLIFGFKVEGMQNYLAFILGIVSIYLYALNPIAEKKKNMNCEEHEKLIEKV